MDFDAKGLDYSICTSVDNGGKWDNISFKNLAEDTYCNDGETVEKKLTDKNTEILNINAAIQNLDTKKQNADTAINTGNIGEQSVKNASTWNGKIQDIATENTTDTWLLVQNGDNIQHRPMSTLDVKNADTLDGKHASDFKLSSDTMDDVEANWNDIKSKANAALLTTGGTMNGDINMNTRAIHDVTYLQGSSERDLDIICFDNSHKVRLGGLASESVNCDGTSYVDHTCNNLHYQGDLVKDSYRGVKENERELTEDEIKKILQIPIKKFDYKKGFGNGKKNVVGSYVDEVEKILPDVVVIPENWDESKFNAELGAIGNNPVPGINYLGYIPYLVAMIQLQQKEIDALKNK